MKDLFNPESKKQNIVNDNNGRMSIRRSSFSKKVNINKRNLGFKEILDENGGLPKKDECLLIKSNGCSDTGSIFQYMINESPCDELYLSTWIISRSNIEYLCEKLDSGEIKKLIFIISVRQKQLKKANYAYMIEEFQKRSDKVKFRVCNCHAKTFSAKIGENHYTVTGSGNWTKNPRIENYTVTNDKEMYLFNKEWMSEML